MKNKFENRANINISILKLKNVKSRKVENSIVAKYE